MTDCEFCAILNGEYGSEEIYQDEDVFAVLHLKPAAPGHILIFTKQHFSILEQVPDFVLGQMFSVANKLSVAIFESLGAQGTNIIIENGIPAGQIIPHFSLHVIPRMENDGLGLQWQPKKVTADDLDTAFLQIREKAENIHPSKFEEKKVTKPVATSESSKETNAEKTGKKTSEDYRLRQLRRIP